MSTAEMLFLAVSLGLDAFAVAVALAAAAAGLRAGQVAKIGVCFGGFQWMMTMSGWLLGHGLSVFLALFSPWCVFLILGGIGLNMIRAAANGGATAAVFSAKLKFGQLILLSCAVSLDALAAGISLALLNTDIARVALGIGLVALVLSVLGATVGRRLRRSLQQRALLLGGLVLIFLGLKALWECLL